MNSPEPPRRALLIASGFGLGYLPIASGTWGSLGGAALYVAMGWLLPHLGGEAWSPGSAYFLAACVALVLAVALVGVWAARVVSAHLKQSDPGVVVIDEISGQLISYLALTSLDWRWLLVGFLLFRALDIWKPFPARQMESWPGGWGIMADDWMAGLYAAAFLWGIRLLI